MTRQLELEASLTGPHQHLPDGTLKATAIVPVSVQGRTPRVLAVCLAVAGGTGIAGPVDAAVTISSQATQNISCANGICAPTAAKAVLNAGDLDTMLASGNVEVTTTGSGVEAQDIDVRAAVTWSSLSALSLAANSSITIEEPASVAGQGSLALAVDEGGGGGSLSFGKDGSVSFANFSSQLTIDGSSYALESSIAALAGAIAADPGGNYALASNYDASADGTYSSSPILTGVSGTVQGLGNTISNLSIDQKRSQAEVALFAGVIGGGTIAGMKLTGVSIKVKDHSCWAGGLAGIVEGTLFNDSASGFVSAVKKCAAGGLAGAVFTSGEIISSSADAKVRVEKEGLAYAGGLAGVNAGMIMLSHARGAVNGFQAGGLVGDNIRGAISQSYATGEVTGGLNGGGEVAVGGLVGRNEDNADINNSYATGAVNGGAGAEVGGLVGENDSTVETSYATGMVAGGAGSLVGGFDGSGSGSFADCYWDTTTSGTDEGGGGTNVPGITGLTTQQLQADLPAGFEKTIWAEVSKINGGLPYLIANAPTKK